MKKWRYRKLLLRQGPAAVPVVAGWILLVVFAAGNIDLARVCFSAREHILKIIGGFKRVDSLFPFLFSVQI